MVNYLVNKPHQNTLWQDFNVLQAWIPTVDAPGWTVAYQQLEKSKGLCRVVKELYDAVGKNPVGSPTADGFRDESSSLRCTKYYQIGMWNVRRMSLGKLEIVKREMNRTYIDILGISELHWTESGHFQSDRFTIYFPGNDSVRRKGVAFIASKLVARCVENHRAYSGRIISIRICSKPLNITILQVYAPTSDATEVETEQFYSEIQSALNQIPKKDPSVHHG